MKTDVMNAITRKISLAGLSLKKHSPEILMVTGVAGMVTSAVMACKASTKVEAILEETKNTLDIVNKGVEEGSINEVEYTEEDGKKDTLIIYSQTALKLAKLYGPAIAVGAASIACVFASNNILRKRSIAIAAAYSAVDKGFKEYRERVVDRFGEDLDRELRYNIKSKEVVETVTDEEGNEKTVTKTVQYSEMNEPSVYAKFFDCGNEGWDKDPEYNLMFLRHQQQIANEMLRSKGYIFLNDVYDMLGIPRTREGQVVGWYYDEKNPVGSNYVDFGIYNQDNPKARDFVNGYERSILLDFNVDGNIMEYIF